MSHLFLSYATDDRALAEEVCALLEANGVTCWIAPRDVAPGARWDEAIVDAISGADAFLLILTSTSNTSSFVANEVNHAFSANKTIFTFRAEDVAPSKSLGFYLARHHWTDGFTGRIEETTAQLAASVTALVASTGSATAGTAVGVGTLPRAAKKARVVTRASRRERLAWTVAGVSFLAATAVTSAALVQRATRRDDVSANEVTRFQITPPDGVSLRVRAGGELPNAGAVSPDGRLVVFSGADLARGRLLYLRRLDSLATMPLAGTDAGIEPFWSPDGQSIGFFADTKLKKADVSSGSVTTIADVVSGNARGGSWGQDGTILYSTSDSDAVFRVSSAGGTPTRATALGATDTTHRWPVFLPDGRHFLFVAGPSGRIAVGSLGTTSSVDLMNSSTNAVFAPPDQVLFVRDGRLFRQRLNLEQLRLEGEPAPIVEKVGIAAGANVAGVSVSSRSMTLVTEDSTRRTEMQWMDRAGHVVDIVGDAGEYFRPALSPDDRRLLFVRAGDVWTSDLARHTLTRLTFVTNASNPVWSPDGATVFFNSPQGFFRKNADGVSPERLVYKRTLASTGTLMQVSPDARALLFFENTGPATGNDIFTVPIDGSSAPTAIVAAPQLQAEPQFSPDGHWLAYMSMESGKREIYVQPFPTTGARWQVSSATGNQPMWRRDGKELFFVTDEKKLTAVDVRISGNAIQFGAPHALFDLPADIAQTRSAYFPSRDGQRFLVNRQLDAVAPPITVVVNWQAEIAKP